jgi:hypothetical protein
MINGLGPLLAAALAAATSVAVAPTVVVRSQVSSCRLLIAILSKSPNNLCPDLSQTLEIGCEAADSRDYLDSVSQCCSTGCRRSLLCRGGREYGKLSLLYAMSGTRVSYMLPWVR